MTHNDTLPDFMRREIEREIHAAEHPVGMSTHDGKAYIKATTLRKLMRLVADNERLREEVRVLRLYGNKDCTSMADEALKQEQPR